MTTAKSKFNADGFRERRRTKCEQASVDLILQLMERERGQPVLPIEPHCCPEPGCNPCLPCTWNTDVACACRPRCIPPRLRKFFDGVAAHDESTAFFRRLRGLRLVVFNAHMANWHRERLAPAGINLVRNEVAVGPDRPLMINKKVQTAPDDSVVLARIASTASAQMVEFRRVMAEFMQAPSASHVSRPAEPSVLALVQPAGAKNKQRPSRKHRSCQRSAMHHANQAKKVFVRS